VSPPEEERAAAAPGQAGSFFDDPILRWARVTIPIHMALPLVLFVIARQKGIEAAAWSAVWSHGVTGVGLLVTLPWWWRRLASMVVLLILDHVATFAVAGVIALFWP
jgi:hypothetical protein